LFRRIQKKTKNSRKELEMKHLFFLIVTLVLLVIGSFVFSSQNISGGERFVARQGGKIEISLVEGEPHDPIDIHAASKSFFRLQDEEKTQFVSDLELKPLGYFKGEYYYLRKLHHSETNLKILNGKARIQFEISEVLEEGQEISIRYIEPVWYKFLFGISLFGVWIAMGFLLDIDFDEL